MKIKTKYVGELDVAEDTILTFEKGIPAFEDETSFMLHPFEEGLPFLVLQSTKTEEVAFILVNPFDFVKDYQVKLSDSTIEQLEIEKQEDVATYAVLTVRDPFEETTANLQGPIVINVVKKKGKQVVSSDGAYQTKHAIFKQTVAAKEGK